MVVNNYLTRKTPWQARGEGQLRLLIHALGTILSSLLEC